MTARAAVQLAALVALPNVVRPQAAPAPAAPVAATPATFDVRGTAVAVEEGRFTVPANRADTGARTLSLAFVRFRSTAASPGAPIVFLAGGPGDAATRALRGMPLDFLAELRAVADVVAFDQRGTGLSEPRNPTCPPGPPLPRERVPDRAEVLAELRARVAACVARANDGGVDVSGLTTAESADDLRALAAALGAPRLTLLAGSYGTHLALATARRHPSVVDRMVLLGVEGMDDTFKLPSRVDAVLATIAAARRPTLLADVRALRSRLAAEPARHPLPTGETIALGEWDVQRWIAESLDTVEEIDAMLAAMPALLDGRYEPLARWALRWRAPRPLNLMNLAMDCASYASGERLARIRREAPAAALGEAIGFPLPDLCDAPGLPRLPDAYRAPATVDTRALLVSGTFDGRTPPPNAADAARTMPRARTLVIDGASHGLFREPAALRAILAFLRE